MDEEQIEQEGDISQKKYRISKTLATFMLAVALLYDGLEFLLDWLAVGLAINPLIAVFAGFHFWLWFRLHDVDFMSSPKRLATKWITDIVEFIPSLDALVVASLGHTIGVLLLLIFVRIEDKTGLKIPIEGKPGKVPTLASAKQGTLQGGSAILKRQAGRNLSESATGSIAKARPTLDSSRTNMMRRAAQRKGARTDIVAVSNSGNTNVGGISSSDNEAAKINRMMEAKKPDWMVDQTVEPALQLRRQRVDVGLRLGKTTQQAYEAALQAEREDDERKKRAA